MKYFLISILFFSLLNCQNSRTIQNNLKHSGNILFDKSITDILFNTIREYPNKSEFALALFVGDTTEYYGIKNEQSSVFTISNESSIFEIGSISKVFLTSLLVQTLKDSLIQLDSKLSSFLPFEISSYGYDNHEVKAIHLANHKSGIPALQEGLIRDYQYDEQDEIYGVGLGWSYSNRNNSSVYFHYGGTVGSCSGIAFDKKNKFGIIVPTNRSALLKSVQDISAFMYKIFGDTYYKYRVQGT